MAAYGALVSLMYIIDQLHHHPSPPIALDKLQLRSLTKYITFLQEFLESQDFHDDSKEADHLVSCIAKAAYAAEDVIESYIVENIQLPEPRSYDDEVIRYTIFYEDLQKVIKEMKSITKEAMEMITEKAAVQDLKRQRRPNVSESAVFPGSTSIGLNNDTVLGFDEVLLQAKDKLIAQGGFLEVIPIVGMGGIGKTALARKLYSEPLVKDHFDICVWVTISQQFNTKQILCDVLSQAKKQSREQFVKMSERALQLEVRECFSNRRFLVVMDDVWSHDLRNEIKRFFRDDKNGSRVLVTTRLPTIASRIGYKNGIEMKFLDEDSSWILFKTMFGEKTFPRELEKIGKEIVGSFKRLPLSIIVIAGLLKKLEHTQERWESIRKKINSIVNLEYDEPCLDMVKMSYDHLPVHLKPCFLYMGVFEEDSQIRVSTLLRLWIYEGFLKPQSGKSLETTAEEYFKDLVGRNLLLVKGMKSNGDIKFCKIHNLLREFCLIQARNEKFYYVIEPRGYPDIYQERRIFMPESTSEEKLLDTLQYMSHTRSLLCDSKFVPLKRNCSLLRSLHAINMEYRYYGNLLDDVFELVNLRYLAIGVMEASKFPSSINLLWNLHTIIVFNPSVLDAPAEIWKMPQLRHVDFIGELHLPDPPSGSDDIVVMENLQSLSKLRNFKFDEEVVKRIPNIKKLRIKYDGNEKIRSYDDHSNCLGNLKFLHKLESLWCSYNIKKPGYLHSLTFPQSLQKLTLISKGFDCEYMLEKTGSLPLLWKLILVGGIFETRKWKTVEGEFRMLRFLELKWCKNLKEWEMKNCSHFPCLEHLVLRGLEVLEEIPLEIGEIPTLRSIELEYCSSSAVESLKRIVEEQGEDQLSFHARVALRKRQKALQCLAAPNIEILVAPGTDPDKTIENKDQTIENKDRGKKSRMLPSPSPLFRLK